MNLIEFDHKGKLIENAQALPIYFSWGVSEGNNIRQITPWFLCKEYLMDTVYSKINNYNETVHGFDTRTIKETSAPRTWLLLIKVSCSSRYFNMQEAIIIIRNVFKTNNLDYSVLMQNDSSTIGAVRIGNWVNTSATLSLLVTLFRTAWLFAHACSSFDSEEVYNAIQKIRGLNDGSILKGIPFTFIKKVIFYAETSKTIEYPRYNSVSLYTTHSTCGIRELYNAHLNLINNKAELLGDWERTVQTRYLPNPSLSKYLLERE